ncbi:MAG: TolC family protein [Gemmatimonadota bacterium]|nr:TolC family protein [Gemmatimonadota bacterium]HEU4990567.1 TolC family protein [Gemmatimonadaceae bacterium]
MKKFWLLAVLPAALGAQQPADSLHPITLKEAIRLATTNAPAAIAAEGQVRTANAGVTSAYAAFVPNLSWSMGQRQATGVAQNPNGQIVNIVKPWTFSTGLTSRLTLFDGGRMFDNIRTAKASVHSAEANEVAQRYAVALNVKTQYYNILAAEESESAARAQLKQAEEQLKVSVAKYTAGAATRSDSLRSAIQVSNARLALLTAQSNVKVASAALTRLVGTQYLVTATPSDTLDQSLTTVDSTQLAHLAADGPGVRNAEASLATARASKSAAFSSYLPSVSISYSRSGSGDDKYYGIGGGSLSYGKTLSLNLSYNIFDNWSREQSNAVADVNVVNARANLRDAQLAAQQSVVQYVANIQTLEEQIKIQEQSIAAAEEDLRVQEQRYAVGASTLLDVLTSQTALNQARVQLIQYRLNYRTTKAQIEQLIGRDLQ